MWGGHKTAQSDDPLIWMPEQIPRSAGRFPPGAALT